MLDTGINLQIDSSINEICEISNKSSGQTRAILYLVVLTAMIQLIVFLNTFYFSWHNLKHKKKIAEIESNILVCQDSLRDNVNDRIFIEKYRNLSQVKLQMERYHMENFELLRIPILNISIHVNDTGLISGILLCILFFILVFTLEREETNLCLALNAITNRYSDESEYDLFKDILEEEKTLEGRKKLLAEINKTRRSFHYNLLTMSEIYTKPEISIQLNKGNKKSLISSEFLNKKYWFAFIILSITFIHDLITVKTGVKDYSTFRTIIHYLLMGLSILLLYYLTRKCNQITKSILIRYNKFKSNDYEFR